MLIIVYKHHAGEAGHASIDFSKRVCVLRGIDSTLEKLIFFPLLSEFNCQRSCAAFLFLTFLST